MADLNQAEIQQLMQSFAQLSNSFQHGQRGVGDYADAQRQAANEIQSSINNASMQIRGAAIEYTKAMFSASEGTAKYAGSLSAVGNAAWEVGKNFGVLGTVAGGLIKIFGDVAAASLKQNDNLTKAYRDFADVGALGGSFDQVIEDLNRVGLSSEQAEEFRRVLEKVNPTLTAFGGGVSVGLKKYVTAFEGMIGVGNQFEQRLTKLGFSVQAMRESVAGYMGIQSKLGLAQSATVGSIQTGSEKYMITLRELEELTGLSGDAAAKNVEQQLANYNWAMKLRELEIQDSKDGGHRAKSAMEFMGASLERYGQEAFTGMVSLAVNGGKAVDEAGSTIQQATRGQFMNAFNNVITGVEKGGTTVEEGLRLVNNGITENQKIHSQTIRVLGDNAKGFTGGTQMLLGALKYDTQELGNASSYVTDTMNQYAPRLTKNQMLEQQDRAMRLSKDKALYASFDRTGGIIYGLNSLLFQFGKVLAKIVDTFSLSFLGKQTHLSDQFKEKEDINGEVKTLEKEKAEIERKLAEIQQAKTKEQLLSEIDRVKREGTAIANKIAEIGGRKDQDGLLSDKDQKELENVMKQRDILKAQEKILDEQKKNATDANGNINLDKLNAANKAKQLELEKQLREKENQIKETKEQSAKYSPFGATPTSKEAMKAVSWDVNAMGQPVNEYERKNRQNAQGAIAKQGAEIKTTGSAEAILSKLKFNDKVKANSAGDPQPELIALARNLQQVMGGTITSMNDDYHKNRMENGKPVPSKHKEGKAFDWVPDEPPANAEEAAAYKEYLKSLGATKVLDEYFIDKNDKSNGGHFHLEVARQGGLFSGPDDGFPVMLHGKNESVWNEKQMHTLLEDVKKSSVDNYKQELMEQMGLNKTNTNTSITTSGNDNEIVMNMMTLLSDKFDTLIAISSQTKSIQDDLLTYTRS